jgi:YD repeat-containing protein
LSANAVRNQQVAAVHGCCDARRRESGDESADDTAAKESSTIGFFYDNANRRTTLTLPNNVTVAYTYDNDSRVTGMTYSAGSTQLGNLTYAYDADGRQTSSGGRLAAVTRPAAVSSSTTAYNADHHQYVRV